MEQSYNRTLMSKFEFNKVAKHFFRTPFPRSTCERLPLRKLNNQLQNHEGFSCAIKSKNREYQKSHLSWFFIDFCSVIRRALSDVYWFLKILDHSNLKHISVHRYWKFLGNFRDSLIVLSVYSMFFVFIFNIAQQFIS